MTEIRNIEETITTSTSNWFTRVEGSLFYTNSLRRICHCFILLVLHYDPVTYLSASKHIFKIIETFLPLVFMYSQFYPAYIKAAASVV